MGCETSLLTCWAPLSKSRRQDRRTPYCACPYAFSFCRRLSWSNRTDVRHRIGILARTMTLKPFFDLSCPSFSSSNCRYGDPHRSHSHPYGPCATFWVGVDVGGSAYESPRIVHAQLASREWEWELRWWAYGQVARHRKGSKRGPTARIHRRLLRRQKSK